PDKNKWITTRQRSCAFVNTPLPCINKAICHIQELELKMEKCFQQCPAGSFTGHDVSFIYLTVLANQTILLKSIYHNTIMQYQYIIKISKFIYDDSDAQTLLLEVTELIKQLEAGCEEAEKALELEKQRRKKFGMKIDCMSLWRLQQLPAAFQKEYEMCVQDTLELQWHFDCKSHQLRQVQNQILKTETVNGKIQKDIDFMKKHSPLLEEKLNLEGEAVKDVLLAYEKVNAN
ncbi:hypothetical protein FQA23_0005935, partial [Aptenodytes patagonicus]